MHTAVSRRQIWGILPLDPSAWVALYLEHQRRYAELREAAMRNAVLTPEEVGWCGVG